jgi:hypothetical protein
MAKIALQDLFTKRVELAGQHFENAIAAIRNPLRYLNAH